MKTRRSQIKRIAAKLFMEKGVAGTSVRDIADGVGILSGSLYHHFASKDAIAFAIIDDFLADLNSRYASVLPHVNGMREEMRALVHSSIEVAANHPYATEIYQNELSFHGPQAPSEISDAVNRAHSFWTEAATRAASNGELRPDLDPHEVARMLRETVWWSVRYHRDTLQDSGTQVSDTLLGVVLDGAAVTSPSTRTDSLDTVAERLGQVESRLETIEHRLSD